MKVAAMLSFFTLQKHYQKLNLHVFLRLVTMHNLRTPLSDASVTPTSEVRLTTFLLLAVGNKNLRVRGDLQHYNARIKISENRSCFLKF
jgi:hypothetical protein